jgi:hypothetical protein
MDSIAVCKWNTVELQNGGFLLCNLETRLDEHFMMQMIRSWFYFSLLFYSFLEVKSISVIKVSWVLYWFIILWCFIRAID